MNILRTTLLTLAFTALATPALAQQTITFDNTSPPITLQLGPSSNFTFEDNGNVRTNCQLGGDNRCVGMPSASNPIPPSATLLADFSTVPDGAGSFAPGTTVSLVSSVSGAEVCFRDTSANTPADTGWTGTSSENLSTTTTLTLNQSNAQYDFTLRCYGTGGKATSSTITVRTNQIAIPGSCVGVNAGATSFDWYQTYTAFTNVPLITSPSNNMREFPNTGAAYGKLVIPRGTWVSLRFTVPSSMAAFAGLQKSINWAESQIGGSASLANTYISVSKCRGDFRAPSSSTLAPAGDPTFARGCRNMRPLSPGGSVLYAMNSVRYEPKSVETASGDQVCNLTLGETYYFNMILASPLNGGGILPGETSCLVPGATQCGIQIHAE